jgi:hypothetical protein
MKKRNEPLRTQRPQSFFFRKAKNTIFFGEYFGNSVSSRSSAVYAYFLILGIKIFPYLYPPLVKKRRSLRRKQRAQRSFFESPLAVLAFREALKMGPLFPRHPGPCAFGHFCLCVLCDLCG